MDMSKGRHSKSPLPKAIRLLFLQLALQIQPNPPELLDGARLLRYILYYPLTQSVGVVTSSCYENAHSLSSSAWELIFWPAILHADPPSSKSRSSAIFVASSLIVPQFLLQLLSFDRRRCKSNVVLLAGNFIDSHHSFIVCNLPLEWEFLLLCCCQQYHTSIEIDKKRGQIIQ